MYTELDDNDNEMQIKTYSYEIFDLYSPLLKSWATFSESSDDMEGASMRIIIRQGKN